MDIFLFCKGRHVSTRVIVDNKCKRMSQELTDGDTTSVDGAKVGVFKERDEVGFNGFLKGTDGRRLEAEVGLEVLSNFTDKTLEGELSDQKLGGFLVATDFTESNGTRLVTMGLLDTASGWGSGFTGSLGSKMLTRGLATSGFTYEAQDALDMTVICRVKLVMLGCYCCGWVVGIDATRSHDKVRQQ